MCVGIAVPEEYAEDAKTMSVRDVARLMAIKALERLAETSIVGVENEFAENIMKDLSSSSGGPGSIHQRKSDSRGALRKQYIERLNEELATQVGVIQQQLDPDGKWFDTDWLRAEVESRYVGQKEEALEDNVHAKFGSVFDKARETARQQQWRRITWEVFPDQTYVSTLYPGTWTAEQRSRLREYLQEQITGSARMPLLEEMEKEVTEKATALASKVEEQMQLQLGAVQKSDVPADAITQAQIERAISDGVEAARKHYEEQKQDNVEPVYELLPSLARLIPSRAQELERQRFMEYVAKTTVPYKAEYLLRVIKDDLAGHRDYSASVRALAREAANGFKEATVGTYSGKIADEQEQGSFKDRLENYLENDAGLKKVFGDRLKTSIEDALKKGRVRETVAEQQMEDHFPRVDSYEWMILPGDDERHLKDYVTNAFSPLKGPAAYSNVAGFLALPGIQAGGKPLEPNHLFGETVTILVDRMKRLLKEAESAWSEQENVVDRYGDAIEEAIAHAKDRNGDYKDVDAWVNHFSGIVKKHWEEVRRKVIVWASEEGKPPTAADKYAKLFDHTVERIREKVTDSIRQVEEDTQKPPETPIGRKPVADPTKARTDAGGKREDSPKGKGSGEGPRGGGGPDEGPGEGTGEGPGGGLGRGEGGRGEGQGRDRCWRVLRDMVEEYRKNGQIEAETLNEALEYLATQ